MELSNRVLGINGDGDDGWSLFNKSRRMIAEGVPVIELTIGEHDIPTDPEILNAMARSAHAGNTGYAPVPGHDALREAVARRVQSRTGVATGKDNVLITPGGQAALFAAHVAVCDPGDTALYCDPYYATYPATIRSAGARALAVPTRHEDNFQPRAGDISKAAKGAKSLLINSPNNPTGVVYSRNTLEGIAQACLADDLWLISDEVYDTQVWDGAHVSPRSLAGMQERTLVVGSMSKSHAMTGSRVGWIIGPVSVVENLINLSTNTTYGVAGFIQDAALWALQAGPDLEARIAAPFRRRRDIATRLVARQNVVQMVPAQGAMYLMLDIRRTGMSGFDFAQALLDTRTIAVMPGESFGRAAAGHVRVAMTVDDPVFENALGQVLDFAARMVQ